MDRPGNGQRPVLKLIGLLLAMNLGLFVAGMALPRWAPVAPATLVFNAEKIRILEMPPASEMPRASAATASELVASDPAPSGLPAGPMQTPDSTIPRCLSWASLDAADWLAIETHLKQAGIVANSYDFVLAKKLGWWVFLPPAENKAGMQALIDEVIRLGITDYAPVRGGSLRNALSLGVFPNLAQAREHAATLSKKGLQGVMLGPRPESGPLQLIFSKRIADQALSNLASGWPKALQPALCAGQ